MRRQDQRTSSRGERNAALVDVASRDRGATAHADVVCARYAIAAVVPAREQVVVAPVFVDDGGFNRSTVGRAFGDGIDSGSRGLAGGRAQPEKDKRVRRPYVYKLTETNAMLRW